jgi:hypothetical protein
MREQWLSYSLYSEWLESVSGDRALLFSEPMDPPDFSIPSKLNDSLNPFGFRSKVTVTGKWFVRPGQQCSASSGRVQSCGLSQSSRPKSALAFVIEKRLSTPGGSVQDDGSAPNDV